MTQPKTGLDPEIARAIEEWVAVAVHERQGPGETREGDDREGYDFGAFLELINDLAPDAIARMLQAGAASYLRSPDEWEDFHEPNR